MEVDRSTLYSFEGPFQLLLADVGNLEFFSKSAANPRIHLLFIDLFTSKVYVYPIKSRKLVATKIECFYKEVEDKRKVRKIRLQIDLKFKHKKYLI